MIMLPTLLEELRQISYRAHGQIRPPAAAVNDTQAALQRASHNPDDLYLWVDVILAGIEGGLRSGASPYALSQAIVNAKTARAARKIPNPLPHLGPDYGGPK